MRETEHFGGDNLLAVKLLLALCVRKGELLGGRRTEFDLEGDLRSGPVWHLPAARTKTGEELDIPLVPQVTSPSMTCVTRRARIWLHLGYAGKLPNGASVTSSRVSREPTIAITTSMSAVWRFLSGRS